ncbi:helix-turn-helix domain-containing protein [Actinosynnema sp. NPDC020468]|uniref:helix-turn-helix domain-containing protein n=1 Tax=Actinosynnema sp. NPDC020468 TaxID=3154488 RepID=UPI0033CB703E
MTNHDFGTLLRRYRTSTGLTQQQLADLSTLSVRAIRDLELGHATRPRRDTVRLLADGLRLEWSKRVRLEVTAGRHVTDSELQAAHDGGAIVPPVITRAMVGRDQEFHTLVDLLRLRRHRWVTVVGLGGVGKSLLAQEVAATMHRQHRFSVLWLADNPVDDGTTAGLGSLASLLSAQLAELLVKPDFDLGLAAKTVGPRDALLVLDGWDRTVPTSRILELLALLPQLQVLVTKREVGDPGPDLVFPLGPLSVPSEGDEADLARLAEVDSVRLLLQHTNQVGPGLNLTPDTAPAIAELCRQLDGLPDMLTMVGQWSLVYSPGQLSDLVEQDVRTLGGVPDTSEGKAPLEGMDSAVAALGPDERRLLENLVELGGRWSVFDVAEHLGRRVAEVSPDVRRLLLRGLVRRVETSTTVRFSVLNLVRATRLR